MVVCSLKSYFHRRTKQEITINETSKSIKPTLFADLGETCTNPRRNGFG